MPQDPHPRRLTQRARDLRRESTSAEEALWELLRDRAFRGLKFRRQVPVLGYVVDFYCPRLRLVVEVDGGVHEAREQRLRDENRDAALEEHGYAVLRFRNEEVLEHSEKVLRRLEAWLAR